MKLEEVISVPAYHLPIECDEPFQMKVMVEGKTEYYEPVDFRLNMIHTPLQTGDIDIIYNKKTKSANIYKNDIITKMYYPPSTKFTTIDGIELIVLKYGPIKRYKNLSRVTVYCKPADEEYTLVETISNKPVLNKILKEINNILLSNEELKKLLTQYQYNWMLYNDTQADDAIESAAHRILDDIGFFEYQEQVYIQKNFVSIMEQGYDTIPNKYINNMYQFSIDFTRKRYPIYYNNVVKLFRMKAIANWLIYIAENINKYMDYSDIAILNKYKDYMKISIGVEQNPVVGIDVEYIMSLPEDSSYNYRIKLYQVSSHLEYVSYNVDAIRLFQINKTTGEEIELKNASMQPDNFDSFVRILEILSGYDHNRLMVDYYNDIPIMIDKMDVTKPSLVENDTESPNDESQEQKLERYISNKVDERTLPKIQEILSNYVLEGSLNIASDGTISNIQNSGGSSFVDSDNEIIYQSL